MRWVIIVTAPILIILCIGLSGQEYSTSICVKTGMIRSTRGYGPFKMHSVQATPLSQVLTQSGYRDPNQHDWLYEHGGGRFLFRRRYSASGNAITLRRTVKSPQVASAVRLMIAHTDKSTVEKWLQRAFDPNNSFEVGYCLGDVEQHTNKTEFVRWLRERETDFTEMRQK